MSMLLACMLGVLSQDLDAKKLFLAAVSAQTPSLKAPELLSFQADLAVSIFERKKDALPKSARVTEYWRKKGERSQYHRSLTLDSSGKTTHLMTDGGSIWAQWEDNTPPTPARDLTQDATAKADLQQLKEERTRMEELLKYFFLANLDGEGVEWSAGEKLPPLDIDGLKVPVLQLIRKKADDPRTIQIVLGTKDHRLYSVRAIDSSQAIKEERFDFAYHEQLRYEGQGGAVESLLVPKRVEYYEDGFRMVSANAARITDIKFNVKLTDKHFQPPRN